MELNEDIHWLIQYKKETLLSTAEGIIKEFKSSNNDKLKAFQQIYVIASILGDQLGFEHFDTIFQLLYRHMVHYKDEKPFIIAIEQVVDSLAQLPLNVTIYRIKDCALNENSKDALISLFYILHFLVKMTENRPVILDHDTVLTQIITMLNSMEKNLLDNKHLANQAYKLIRALSNLLIEQRCKSFDANLIPKLFEITVSVYNSTDDTDLDQTLSNYAQYFNLSTEEFIFNCVGNLLEGIYTSKNYETWDTNSLERIKFNSIVSQSSFISLKFLDLILIVLSQNVRLDNEVEMRFEALDLLNTLIHRDKESQMLQKYSDILLKQIIKEALVWKMGKPNIKIRKAGSYCFIDLLKYNLISKESLLKTYDELLPILKSCLSDDWAPDLRYSTVICFNLIFDFLSDDLEKSQFEETYAVILERLDDAQDDIRIKAAEALEAMFNCRNFELSKTLCDYMIKTLFVHFDDSNEELQAVVLKALLAFATFNKKMVLDYAKTSLPKFRYPDNCENLIASLD